MSLKGGNDQVVIYSDLAAIYSDTTAIRPLSDLEVFAHTVRKGLPGCQITRDDALIFLVEWRGFKQKITAEMAANSPGPAARIMISKMRDMEGGRMARGKHPPPWIPHSYAAAEERNRQMVAQQQQAMSAALLRQQDQAMMQGLGQPQAMGSSGYLPDHLRCDPVAKPRKRGGLAQAPVAKETPLEWLDRKVNSMRVRL